MMTNLLFSQTTALGKTLGKRLAMVLTMLLIVGIGQAWGAEVFNITSYTSFPTGWTNNNVTTGSYFKFDEDGCSLTTSTYDPHTDLTLTYKVATYGSGTNHPLTIQLLDENDNVKQTHTTGTPTSSTYITGTWSIGTVNYKFKIKFYLAETGRGVRLQVPKLVGTPAPSCSNQVTITKASATGGSFKVRQGSASGTEISSGDKIDNCDANAVVVVVPSASANYTCTSVNATNSNSISGPDGSGNYTITYTKDSNISSEISVTFTENQTHTVTWIVNGNEYTEGTPTASVYEGAKWSSLTLPTAPNPNDYCGQVFAGWTTTNIGSTGLDKDNDATAIQNLNLMTSENKSSKTNTITEPTTFYAVFADYAD